MALNYSWKPTYWQSVAQSCWSRIAHLQESMVKRERQRLTMRPSSEVDLPSLPPLWHMYLECWHSATGQRCNHIWQSRQCMTSFDRTVDMHVEQKRDSNTNGHVAPRGVVHVYHSTSATRNHGLAKWMPLEAELFAKVFCFLLSHRGNQCVCWTRYAELTTSGPIIAFWFWYNEVFPWCQIMYWVLCHGAIWW